MAPLEQLWDVVGGDGKGGILVREGHEVDSPMASKRLSTGSIVKELDARDGRLHFKRLTGTGPATGWALIRMCERELLRPRFYEFKERWPVALELAMEWHLANRHIVAAAVARNWKALSFAVEGLRSDREIVWTAVAQDGSSLSLASKALQEDPALALAASMPRESSMLGGLGLNSELVVTAFGQEEQTPLLRYAWNAGALEVEAAAELGSPTLEVLRQGLRGGSLVHVRFDRPQHSKSSAPQLRLPVPREEQCIDPKDDQLCTFLDVERKYAGLLSEAALRSYWRNSCEAVVRPRWRREASCTGSVVWRTPVSHSGGAVMHVFVPAITDALFVLFAQAACLSELLVQQGWGFVDGFLHGVEADELHLALRSWWEQRAAGDGVGSFSDWGSFPELARAEERVRVLVEELRRQVPELSGFAESEPPMRAVMHGGSHPPHFDCLEGGAAPRRVCTLILYLNPFWCEDHGGLFRLYPESVAGDCAEAVLGGGWVDTRDEPNVDIAPLHGRLLAFLCEGRNAHEVLPCLEPRFAVTWWLRCN